MPVIINDFEMVVEPRMATNEAQQDSTQQATATTPMPVLRPEDIEQIIRRFEQRRTRVRAD